MDQALQRFIWKDGRFVAWHAPERFYGTRENWGVVVELDGPGAAGRVIRRAGEPMGHVAISAGDIRFSAPGMPEVDEVLYQAGFGSGAAPAATTGARAQAWQRWLEPLVRGVQQVVHTRFLLPPAHVLHLGRPWEVSMGGKPMAVRWVGVGVEPPHRGLLYLASGEPRPGHDWPPFTVALYTRAGALPLPVPPARPLAQYLRVHPELDAFITDRPEAWADAVRSRGIAKEGWPAPWVGPHLEGPSSPDPELLPEPDHLLVTVLNGFVRRAERKGDDVHVEVAVAPGRAYRWILPLTGFNRSTRIVRVQLNLPGAAPKVEEIALDGWHSWNGDPGPGSLIPEEDGTRP